VLPSTGVKGTIYLVPSGQSAPNVYDEYLWLDDAGEIIGTTQIDLSGYVKTEDMNAALSKKVSGTDTTTAGNVANFGQDGYSVVDSGYKIEKSVPADAKFTDTDTGITTVVANDGLTQSINGRTLTLGLSSKIVSSVHDITYSEGTVSGDSVVFTINHNLGTSILNMNIVKTNAPVIYLSPLYIPNITVVDDNTINVIFSSGYFSDTSNTYRIYLLGYVQWLKNLKGKECRYG